MPVSGAIALTGAKELDRQLGLIEPKLQRKALLEGVKRATKYVKTDVERRAPKKTGALGRSYKMMALAKRGGTREQRRRIGRSVLVSRSKFKAARWYAPYVELGTSQRAMQKHLRAGLWENKRVVEGIFRGQLYVGIKEIARTARSKINNAHA